MVLDRSQGWRPHLQQRGDGCDRGRLRQLHHQLKILFVSEEYPPDTAFGGIGFNLGGLVPALVARGHEVRVLSCSPGQAQRDVLDGGAIVHRRPRVSVPGLKHLAPGPLGARIEAAISTWRAARRLDFRPDVVNIPDWMGEGLLFSTLGAVPVVAYLHTPLRMVYRHGDRELGLRNRLADWLERTAVRRSTIVTSTSRQLADDLLDDGWLVDADVRVMPAPVASERFHAVPSAAVTAPSVLVVGRLEALKQPEVVLQAAALLRDIPDLTVVFAGRSNGEREGQPYARWLEQEAERLGVRCRIEGQLDADGMRDAFAATRVVAVPSRRESFSIVTLEAMAAGRPVIVNDRVGAREVLEGEDGLIVPVGDRRALADALRPYLSDAGRAADVGRRLRGLVEARCSPERIAELRESVYAEAITRFRPGPMRRLLGRVGRPDHP